MNRYYDFYKRAEAEAAASALTERRIGKFALGSPGEPADPSRVVVGYEVQNYSKSTFGVVERWQYVDRPDLGTLGGGFILRTTINRLLGL